MGPSKLQTRQMEAHVNFDPTGMLQQCCSLSKSLRTEHHAVSYRSPSWAANKWIRGVHLCSWTSHQWIRIAAGSCMHLCVCTIKPGFHFLQIAPATTLDVMLDVSQWSLVTWWHRTFGRCGRGVVNPQDWMLVAGCYADVQICVRFWNHFLQRGTAGLILCFVQGSTDQ